MALTPEDGTGLPNADSYVSASYADAYHMKMGNTEWEAADALVREAALRRAAQYLDTRYRYRGEPLKADQALAWPRTGTVWPVRAVQDAACELALRALDGPLYEDVDDAPVTQEKVGPISVSYGHGINGGQVRYALVDDLLRGLTVGAGRLTLRVERAS